MKVHHAHMSDNFLDLLVGGTKLCELRINNEKWQKVEIEDKVIFIPKNKSLKSYKGTVYKREEFKTFEEAIDKIGFNNLMPGYKNKEEVLNKYKSFPGAENISKFGCVCLFFSDWKIV